MYDIIIIGVGPAGLTAGIYARRASKKVLILDEISYGGQIINTLNIENYPTEPNISGFDFATKLYNQAKDLGCEIKFEKVLEINDNKELEIDGLFIAIGRIPNSDIFKNLIDLDESRFIISSENCHTNKESFFVAGDVRTKSVRQLVTATSDGAIAAIEAVKYISNIKRD